MTDGSNSAAAAAATQTSLQSPVQSSVLPSWAGWIAVALIALGVVALGGAIAYGNPFGATSLGFSAIAGVTILSVGLCGLIALTRAIGMATPYEALALPKGSVRALLALILATVFVAVSSWTLGGLFDPLGPLVYATQVAKSGDAEQKALTPYSDKQYVIFKTDNDKGDQEAIKVYLRREAPTDQVMDIAKQIITVSATVLVTIVGFYFGSKSAADAVSSAGASLAAVRKAMTNADDGDGATSDDAAGGGATVDDVRKSANAIGALSTSMQNSLQNLGDKLTLLHQAADGVDAAKDLLATAVTSYATLNEKAKAGADLAAQAKALASTPDNADAATVQSASSSAQKLLAEATQANHDFAAALAAFNAAQTSILKLTAKG